MTKTSAAARELANRTRWTVLRCGELVNQARDEGWLAGDPLDLPPSMAVLEPIDNTTPMNVMAARLQLADAELEALWLLACVELAPVAACAAEQLFVMNANAVTLQILEQLVALGEAPLHAGALARLAQLGLIEVPRDSRLPSFRRPVRATDRVLALARGELALDIELAAVASLRSAVETRRATLPMVLPTELRGVLADDTRAVVIAHGIEGSGRTTLLAQAVATTGRSHLHVRIDALSTDRTTFESQLRAIARECQLHAAWPVLSNVDHLDDERTRILIQELVESYEGPVFATAREPLVLRTRRPAISVHVQLPDSARRRELWTHVLGEGAPEVIADCAQRYTISPALITAAAASVSAQVKPGGIDDAGLIHRALRSQLERKLAGLATRIETRQTWNDLVLPVDQFDMLIELVARIRHRTHVLDTWGFADKVGRGIGVSALFSGPPGTGKTMIAGLLANELGLDLYQVDLSKVVSKYIGETEKQLAAVFEAAESGHAIILFDEADSLFGKRTEVKSSNDRYANLEVNYLLQRMEAFRGITLMTTNHETAIDQAFQRRLAFHVRVPMPDEAHRAMLWRSMLPERADVADDLDVEGLAREFSMTGGYIKNAALRAAFLAADAGTGITNEHLWRAARAEYEAMGKIFFHAA